MTKVEETIARLRTTGRWNPFLRCFLLILAWIAFGIVYGIPIFAFFAALLAPAGVFLESSLAFIVTTLVQFLAALTAVLLFRRTLDRQSFSSLGLELRPGWAGELAWGAALGTGLTVLAVAIFALFGWVEFVGSGWSQMSLASVLVWTLGGGVSLVMVAFYEELIARGYLVQNLSAGRNIVVGVVVSSAVFGLAHLMNPESSLLAVANTGLAGLFFALLYLWTGSLWAPIGAHFGWNFAQNYVSGLPVSGVDIFAGGSPLLLKETGPDIVTGGAFGPEGGLIVTVVLVAAALYFLLKLTAKQSPIC